VSKASSPLGLRVNQPSAVTLSCVGVWQLSVRGVWQLSVRKTVHGRMVSVWKITMSLNCNLKLNWGISESGKGLVVKLTISGDVLYGVIETANYGGVKIS
jgi:hypothetical protein